MQNESISLSQHRAIFKKRPQLLENLAPFGASHRRSQQQAQKISANRKLSCARAGLPSATPYFNYPGLN